MSEHWERVNRRDRRAIALADRHYSRTVVGAPQVGGAGFLTILVTPAGDAAWIARRCRTNEDGTGFGQVHGWSGAWENTMFRNESVVLSSTLIREAVAITRWVFGDPPPLGMVTFVNADLTRHKRDPGRCYLKAGFKRDGFTKGGLWVMRLHAEDFPAAMPPLGALDFAESA